MTATASTQATELFAKAQGVLAGGVSASMRLHPYLGRPLYSSRGDGAHLYDLEGKRFIDFNMANGAALLGHNHPKVKAAVEHGLALGIICAAETPFHEELAARLVEIIPAAERVRFSTVGSEVTLVALRIARAATGRQKYLKFDGHFHGLTEPWLFKSSDPMTSGSPSVPSSAGVPADQGKDAVIVPWNNFDAFKEAMAKHGDELAAVICEPIHYNAGCIPPADGFLELLREETTKHGIILIFDEVLSGFRTALGGVQAEYGVTPDLTTHAKALANGMPLSSLGGRAELMNLLAPTGGVAHSGTYSGHPLSVLAALATLEELSKPGVYDKINATADTFYADFQEVFDRGGLPVRVQGRGARFGLYFGRREPVTTWTDALTHDHGLNQRFSTGLLDNGVYLHAYTRAGAPGHAGFSTAHTPEDFAETLNIAEKVVKEMQAGKR